MRIDVNKLKKQTEKKAQQNRAKRVENSNKHFKTQTSKSQKDYIAGDVISSASKKAYGYEKYGKPETTWITGGRSKSNYKKVQEGKNPYEAKYMYDGKKRTVKNDDGSTFTSRKRFLNDDEKKAIKVTGTPDVKNYKDNYTYAIFRGKDSDGKTFKSNLNLTNKDGSMKWDGMQVAKNKVNAGGSKLNYVGGFLKDTVFDAGVDALKIGDRYSTGLLHGLFGVADTIDSINTNGLKNADFSSAKKYWDKNIEESNKTGWARSTGDMLKEMWQTQDDRAYQMLKDKKGIDSAEAYKKSEQSIQGIENVVGSVAGLYTDFKNPIDLISAGAKTFKFAGKNAIKAGKELVTGTADLSLAFRKADDVLDVLTGHTKNTSGVLDNSLNKEYERAMSKAEVIKDIVKSNPTTKNLGSFLDEIGENVLKGKQRNIDGRTLNKKYTQTKDGYIPNLLNNVEESVVKDNPINGQLSFGDVNKNNKSYNKFYNKYQDENELFNAIDELDDVKSDEVLDWLKTNKPETYKKYIGVADEVDEFANQGILSNTLSQKRDNSLIKSFNKNAQTITEKPKYDYKKTNEITEQNAIEKIASLFDKKAPKTYTNSYERKHAFEGSIRNLSKDMFEGKVDSDDLVKTIKSVKGKDVPTSVKREYTNNKLFDGNQVIASNVSSSSIDGLLDSVEDLANLKKVVSEYQKTGEILPVVLSDSTKDFLKIGDDLKIKGSTVRGNKINDPEELLETLNKSIVDRARALTDERYGDKLQLMARELGYDKYQNDILDSIEKLKTRRKELDALKTKTAKDINEQVEISANLKRLNNIKKQREDMWARIKNIPEKEFDKLVDEKFPHHKEGLNSYNFKANQRKEMNILSKGDEFSKLLDETADASNGRKLTIDDFYNEVTEEIKGTQKLKDYIAEGGNVDELIEQQAKIRYKDYRNEMEGYKLKQNIDNRNATVVEATERNRVLSESPRFEQENANDVGEIVDDIANRTDLIYKELKLNKPKINKSKIKLSNGQKLGHLPPVKENSAGLKKVIQRELEIMYKEPKKYLEYKDSFKQIKREYVKSMRSYGVKDSSYFDKVKNLQNDLELYYKELNKPTNIIKKSSEGGSGTAKLGMNLQLLAKKIEDTFKEFDENIVKEFKSTKNITSEASDKLLEFFHGNTRQFENQLKMYENKTSDELLDMLSNATTNPNSKNNLTIKSILERRGIDYSKANVKNVEAYKNEPTSFELLNKKNKETQERIAKMSKPTKKSPLDKVIKDDVNPFNAIKGGVDDISNVTQKSEKVRRVKTQAEIDEINKKIKSLEEPVDYANILGNAKETKRLPRVSELVEQGLSKEEAFEIIEKMKKGEIEIPSSKIVQKADKRGGYNTTTEINSNELNKVLSNLGDNKPSTPLDNVKFGVNNKRTEIPKGKVLNESTGEVENLSQYVLGRKIKPDADVYDVIDKTEDSIPKSLIDEIADEIGATKENPPTFEKFKKFFTEKTNDPIGYEDSAIYKAYKSWLNTWKKGLTVYNPGWHVQNFFQNKGQNYLGLGTDAFKSQKNARNVLAHINGKDKGTFNLTTKDGVVYTKAELAKLAKDFNIAEGMGTNATRSNGVFPWLETKVDNSSIMKKLLQSEQTARLHHFLTQLERGMSPEKAAKSVNDYLFDYSSKSKADKMISDFVDPFWSFHKSNAKMLTSAPFKNNTRVNATLKLDRELDNVVKEDDKESNSYREHQLPFGDFTDELNGDRYTYHYDENMLPDIEDMLPVESDDLDSKLNPLIRLAMQQSRGEGNFGNKIVEGDKAGYDEVTKSDRLKEVGLELNPVLNPLFKTIQRSNAHQKKTEDGKQTQDSTNAQVLHQWLAYILGNKGNYYRNIR